MSTPSSYSKTTKEESPSACCSSSNSNTSGASAAATTNNNDNDNGVCSTGCKACTYCTCGDDCRCTETICRCQASSILNSLGVLDPSSPPTAVARSPQQQKGRNTNSCCKQKQKTKIKNNTTRNEDNDVYYYNVMLSIKGMHCQSCVRTIERALHAHQQGHDHQKSAAPKYEKIVVNLKEEIATLVVIQDNKQDMKILVQKLNDVIEDVGFDSSIIKIEKKIKRVKKQSPKKNNDTIAAVGESNGDIMCSDNEIKAKYNDNNEDDDVKRSPTPIMSNQSKLKEASGTVSNEGLSSPLFSEEEPRKEGSLDPLVSVVSSSSEQNQRGSSSLVVENGNHDSENNNLTTPLLSSDNTEIDSRHKVVELVISGMTCSMCTKAVSTALTNENGIKSVAVNLATDMATIEYVDPVISINKIKSTVEDIGYDVTDIFYDNNGDNDQGEDDDNNNGSENDDENRFERITRRQEEEVQAKKVAFLWSLAGTLPILILTMVLPYILPENSSIMKWLHSTIVIFSSSKQSKRIVREALILWLLATPVQFLSGWTFYRNTFLSITKTGQLGMDVLVTMGTTASYGYAFIDTFFKNQKSCIHTPSADHTYHFFETSAVLICFVLLGKYMQCLAVRKTSDAITQLIKLQSKTALRITPRKRKRKKRVVEDEKNVSDNQMNEQINGDNDNSISDDGFNPLVDPYDEEIVNIKYVKPNDIVKILRGSSIPADGIVTYGEMSVDESMITGESIPVLKTSGSIVLGGTICVETSSSRSSGSRDDNDDDDDNDENNDRLVGTAFVRVTGVGSSTALSQIVKLVQDAQTRQVPIQNLADAISSIFVPTVATLSIVTFLVWYALCNTLVVPAKWYNDLNESDVTFSLMFGIACLVISCPCALGLATPTAIMVGTGVGAKNGVLVKGGESLEKASSINAVVFDKTGTLTKGTPCITDFHRCDKQPTTTTTKNDRSRVPPASKIPTPKVRSPRSKGMKPTAKITNGEKQKAAPVYDDDFLLWLLGSLERNSEHPLAKAVVAYAEEKMGETYLKENPFVQPSNFQALTGRGAHGVIDDSIEVAVGNRAFATMLNIPISHSIEQLMTSLEEEGKTAILASVNGTVIVVMGVADQLKADAASSIQYLRDRMHIDVWMVTGDNKRTANAISRQINLPPNRVISEALPIEKIRQVRKLQSEGQVVAMIGDGINDSPALAQADVGMSIGTGAEIAAEASDMVLVRGHVADVCTALDLSRVIFRRIQLNFVWSLLYNICGIPVAAGAFFPLLKTRLPPTVAALAMALSSLSVVTSSLALRLYRPPKVVGTDLVPTGRGDGAAVVGASTTPRRFPTMGMFDFFRWSFSDSGGRRGPVLEREGDDERTQSLIDNDHLAVDESVV